MNYLVLLILNPNNELTGIVHYFPTRDRGLETESLARVARAERVSECGVGRRNC